LTPEGYIKAKIDKVLKEFELPHLLWWHKPVQNGMGRPCLDYHCCYRGWYFAIEAKGPEGKLTKRQEITKMEIEEAGGKVFVINDDAGVKELHDWLWKHRK
jgi:hypothetical protein